MKLIDISSEEMGKLREQIATEHERILGRRLVPNSYLPRYQELAGLISAHIEEEHNDFVSPVLLRRLFYYERNRKSARFNQGFLDACYRFVSSGTYNRTDYLKQSPDLLFSPSSSPKRTAFSWPRTIVLFIAVSLLSIGIIAFRDYFSDTIVYFYEDFTHGSEGLKLDPEWTILDQDDSYWNRSDSMDHLTLFTQRGGYWVKKEEQPQIHNLVARKLGQGDFSLTTLIDNFRPSKNWQQAALLLIENELNHTQLAFAYDDVASGRPKHKVDAISLINGDVFQIGGEIDQYLDKESLEHRLKIWLRIDRHGNEYSFLYKPQIHEDRAWITLGKWQAPSSFQPKHLALGAFQGITQILPSGELLPLNWEPVPAHFDHVELKPLH